ncbi:DUF2569 domain-containing protein [Paenibacillus lautus]|uniref:DUF2569 domain-containing protein n=1 Tax=Paenibacillus lautus TaxID=1401 RepID=UPI001C7D52EC|nr:DUF2569 domain-containing protein [Paenibacillus lautus]MBX4146471.1 DUF2569 domain-containing protein [Paenibacillus lautus]
MDPNQVQENNPGSSPQGQTPKYLIKLKVEGLGGWLVLVQISMYFSLITITYLLFNHIFPVFEPEIWSMITDKGSAAYTQSLVQLILFETVVNVLFIIALVFALFLLYRKKKAFPKLMIGYILFSLLTSIVDYVAVSQIEILAQGNDGTFMREVTRSILYACIWIPYFIRSKRVRNTFVN